VGQIRRVSAECLGYTSVVQAKHNRRKVNRYDVTGNSEAQSVDHAGNVLVNKKGILALNPLQILEEDALATAYTRLIGEVRSDTALTCTLIRHVHGRMFGDLQTSSPGWRYSDVMRKPPLSLIPLGRDARITSVCKRRRNWMAR